MSADENTGSGSIASKHSQLVPARTWPVHREALAAAYAEGLSAWPRVALCQTKFEAHCERVLGENPDHDWACHARDLFLCCACAAGNAEANRILERDVLAPIGQAQLRKHKNRELSQETLQVLRTKLLVGPGARIGAYAARGPLNAWLSVAAARVMVDLQRAQKSHASFYPNLNTAIVDDDPAAGLTRARYLASFSLALKSAIQSAPAVDRHLLRSCISGASIDQLGRAYSIHRATAARWLERARQRIFEAFRQQLTCRHGLSDEELESLARELCEHLDGTLESLQEADAPEPELRRRLRTVGRAARSRSPSSAAVTAPPPSSQRTSRDLEEADPVSAHGLAQAQAAAGAPGSWGGAGSRGPRPVLLARGASPRGVVALSTAGGGEREATGMLMGASALLRRRR